MQWNWVDLTIISIIALSILTGLIRGFVKEIIALITWALAIWLSFTYSQMIDPWLADYLHDQTVRKVASVLIILFAVLLAGGIVNAMLSFILKRSGLSGTDRSLGMGFGFVRGVFMVALLLMAVKMTSLPYQQYRQDSQLYAKFDPLVAYIYGFMPDFIKQINTHQHEADIQNATAQTIEDSVTMDKVYSS